ERSLGELHPGTILGTLVGSRDANHAAFIARHGLKWFVIHDGKIGTEKYDLPAPFAQIPQDQKEKVVRQLERDGKLEEALAPALGRPVFSPDGARLAYIATRAVAQEAFHWLGVATPVKQFVVADGAEGEKYHRIVQGSLVFSPDSRRLAYAAEKAGTFVVVVDGKEGDEFGDIYNPVFSPDSQR